MVNFHPWNRNKLLKKSCSLTGSWKLEMITYSCFLVKYAMKPTGSTNCNSVTLFHLSVALFMNSKRIIFGNFGNFWLEITSLNSWKIWKKFGKKKFDSVQSSEPIKVECLHFFDSLIQWRNRRIIAFGSQS